MEMTPSPVRWMFMTVLRRTPRDIALVTIRIVLAQSKIPQRGDHISPQIMNLLMMQNDERYREGRQQQEFQVWCARKVPTRKPPLRHKNHK